MAIDAKMNLIDQTRQRLGSMITVDAMEKVITVLSDVIEGYDFRIKESWTGEEKDDLLECFLDAMSVQGRSLKTIARYRYVITKMMEEVKIPTRQITVYHLRKYINGMKDRGLQESTMEEIRNGLHEAECLLNDRIPKKFRGKALKAVTDAADLIEKQQQQIEELQERIAIMTEPAKLEEIESLESELDERYKNLFVAWLYELAINNNRANSKNFVTRMIEKIIEQAEFGLKNYFKDKRSETDAE